MQLSTRNKNYCFTANIVAALLGILVICVPHVAHTQNNSPSIDKVKSVYIYNFSKFVRWENPLNKLPSINFCIINAPAISGYLQEIVGQEVQGKPVKVETMENLVRADHCHVVFVREGNAENILLKIARRNEKQADS